MKFQNVKGHLHTVIKHKIYVAKYCFIAGLYWEGITHDLSKFSPAEFIESVKYYQGTTSPINACKADKGYSNAWLHHKGRNKHHYEFWQDDFDKGTKHLIMPFKYSLAMICDYLGAANAYNGDKFTLQDELEWWNNKNLSGHVAMAEPIWHFVDKMLNIIATEGNLDVLRKRRARKIYNYCIKKYS